MNLAHHTSQMRARLPAQFLKMGKSNPLAIFYPKFAQKAAIFRANWHRVPVNSTRVVDLSVKFINPLIKVFLTDFLLTYLVHGQIPGRYILSGVS